MNKLTRWLIPLGVLGLIPVAMAQDALQDHPGFVDFSALTAMMDSEPTVEISLKEPLLAMVTNLIRAEDQEAADFISKLLRVTVNVFRSEAAEVDEVAATMENIAGDLEQEGWERVVRVREDQDHVDIYVRMSGDAQLIHGIAIMVAEPNETVLVNIVGDISGNDLAALGRRFDIDALTGIDIEAAN
ncbi:MAG: DUF4252 domain-containing protein [Pseudohongiellaceae bacterium]